MTHWIVDFVQGLAESAGTQSLESLSDLQTIQGFFSEGQNYFFRSEIIEEVSTALEITACNSEFLSLLTEAGRGVGFSHVSLVIAKTATDRAVNRRGAASWSECWTTCYCELNGLYSDPALAKAMHLGTSFAFSESDFQDPWAKNFIGLFQVLITRFRGVCIPVISVRNDIVVCMFFADMSVERIKHIFCRFRSDLEYLAQVASDAFLGLNSVCELDRNPLSDVETDMLKARLAASDCLEVSKPTDPSQSGDALTKSICRKLGVETIPQALWVAAKKGWLDDLPIKPEEIVVLNEAVGGGKGVSGIPRPIIGEDFAIQS